MVETNIDRHLLANILDTSRAAFLDSETIQFFDESARLEHLTVLLRNMLAQLQQLGITRVAFDSMRINKTQVILIEGESSKVISCTLDEAEALPINCLVLEGLTLAPFTQTETAPAI